MIATSALVAAGLVLIFVGLTLGTIIMNGGGGPLMLASFALGIVMLGLAVVRHFQRRRTS